MCGQDTKISQLPSVLILSATDLIPIVNGGSTKKITVADFNALNQNFTINYVGENFLPLSGGEITGNLIIDGNLNVNGDLTYLDTEIISTSAMVLDSETDLPALRITQRGLGPVVLIEDFSNPDSSPFIIKNNGNVGIGSDTANEKLQVEGNVKISQNLSAEGYIQSGSGKIINSSNKDFILLDPSNNSLNIYLNNNKKFEILNNGNGSLTGNLSSSGTITAGTITTNLTGTSVLIETNGLIEKRTINTAAFDTTAKYVSALNGNLFPGYLTKAGNEAGIDESIIYNDNNKIGINTNTPSTTLHVSGTDALILPVGDNSQRPSSLTFGLTGAIRYNTEGSTFEGFNGNSWGSLGGVIDTNKDTYISAENFPGANNDELKFYTYGDERMRILSGGNVGIGVIDPSEKLTIGGNLSSSGMVTVGTMLSTISNRVVILSANNTLATRDIDSSVWNDGALTFTQNLTVSLPGGKTFGRYVNNSVIPAINKTAADVIKMAIAEPIPPDVTLSSSTSILFNQTNINNLLTFTHKICSLGAQVDTALLEWRRNGAGTWEALSTSTASNGTYTHSMTDTNYNTQTFNYRYTVTDTAGGTNSTTFNITPASYSAPTRTITLAGAAIAGNETATSREIGNVSTNITGSITRSSASTFVPLVNAMLQYSNNGGSTWQDIGTAINISSTAAGATYNISSTNHNPTSDVNSTSLRYRIRVIDAYQQFLASQLYTSDAIITFFRILFIAAQTGPNTPANNSAAVRLLPNTAENRIVNPAINTSYTITVPAGTTRMTIAYPASLGAANGSGTEPAFKDTVNNFDYGSNFGLPATPPTFNVDGANGATGVSYYVYTYIPSVAIPSQFSLRLII